MIVISLKLLNIRSIKHNKLLVFVSSQCISNVKGKAGKVKKMLKKEKEAGCRAT